MKIPFFFLIIQYRLFRFVSPVFIFLSAVIFSAPACKIPFTILSVIPHKEPAFTQGLSYHRNVLYESSGLYGKSAVKIINPSNGVILRIHNFPSDLFAEGIAVYKNIIYCLTWKNGRLLTFDLESLAPGGEYRYQGEGWGLAFDGTNFIRSSGESLLFYHRADDFKLLRKISVTLDGAPLQKINELEYVKGKVYANVWMKNFIAVIEPDGTVSGIIDFSIPAIRHRGNDPDNVLNGIAWDAKNDVFYITGKNWPLIYRVNLDISD